MRTSIRLWLLLCLFWVPLKAADLLQMPIGDPARKDRRVPLMLDAVTDAQTGETITLADLVQQLAGVQLVFVGENHTSTEVHQIQERIIRALADSGRTVLVGLEMFPYTEQKHLDSWNSGYLTEEGFVRLADWYRNWGYNWRYYRSIFLMAQQRNIPLFAVNTPRSVVSAVRQKGFDGLSEEERAHVPETVDTENPEHFELFKAFFASDDEDEEEGFHTSLSEEQWQGMFNAQCTWDASMGYNATQTLARFADRNPIMVVLVGAGHVAYGLGIERQAAQWFDGKMASVIPLPVRDGKGEPIEEVQASYANYLWGYPPERFAAFPALGISSHADKESGRLKVIFVEKESAAERAGLKTGDLLLTLEGEPLEHRSQLNSVLASKEWGDSLQLGIQRDAQTLEITVYFRRVWE